MNLLEVGIRELQRGAARLVKRVEAGAHVVVTRHGKPVAVVLPLDIAAAWIARNRPLPWQPLLGDGERAWSLRGDLRIAVELEHAFDELPTGERSRLLRWATTLRNAEAYGRVALRSGSVFALVDFEGPRRQLSIIALDRQSELRSWLWAGEAMSLRASMAATRDGAPSKYFDWDA